jgi:hypothetical protein
MESGSLEQSLDDFNKDLGGKVGLRGKIIKIARACIFDKRLTFIGCAAIGLHLGGMFFKLYSKIPEFDCLTHLLSGFALSEYIDKGAHSIDLHKSLIKKMSKYRIFSGLANRLRGKPNYTDFLIRYSAFFLLGGLLWESTELITGLGVPTVRYGTDTAVDLGMGAIGTALSFKREH